MLISYQYEFVFIKTVKSAGSSIERCLSQHLDDSAIVTPTPHEELTGRERVHWGRPPSVIKAGLIAVRSGRTWITGRQVMHDVLRRRGPVNSGESFALERSHSGALLARDVIGAQDFARFRKVSVIRNPYDWVVSYYFWQRNYPRQTHVRFPSLGEWLVRHPGILVQNRDILEIDGVCAIDDFIRYEDLPEALGQWAATVGLDGELITKCMSVTKLKSGIRPAGERGSARSIIDPASKELIDHVCGWIFDQFGYEMVL